jgi:hypothetical protein
MPFLPSRKKQTVGEQKPVVKTTVILVGSKPIVYITLKADLPF